MTARDRLALGLERRLRAPRAAVYRALTDADELGKWWGPKGFTAPSVEFHPHVGHEYRIAMQPPDGDLFHLSGVFRDVEPPARLAYTFRWDPPHPDDRETLVTLSLEDRGPRPSFGCARAISRRRDATRSTKQAGPKASSDSSKRWAGSKRLKAHAAGSIVAAARLSCLASS